jgi:RNA polymerase sigma-70 factor, ECF subfamily
LWATPIKARLASPPLFRWPAFPSPLVVAHACPSWPEKDIQMINDDSNGKLNRFVYGIIHRKVKQLIGRAGFTKQDHEDIEQELLLRVLQSLPSFNPHQAHYNVFITTVVERYVANVLRNKQAKKRDYRRISSLNVMIADSDGDPTELSETIGQQELDARRGRHSRSDAEHAQLQQDIADVIASLPEDMRDLAERLKTQNVSEIARGLGIPRTTLHESVRRLRLRFEQAGLKEYL